LKIEQNKTFEPIIITIETEEEARELRQCLSKVSCPALSFIDNLFRSINIMLGPFNN